MDQAALQALLQTLITEQQIISVVLSAPRLKQEIYKSTIRPLMIKQALHYQVTDFTQTQTFHRNFKPAALLDFLLQQLRVFKHMNMFTHDTDYQVLVGKKHNITVHQKPATKVPTTTTNNRDKHYILPEFTPVPFLVELGIMAPNGKVIAQKYDKFKQINRFLELVQDSASALESTTTLRIVDFGCGKSYLTFALYHYFHVIKGHQVHITGLDLKADVITLCQTLAEKLAYSNLTFQQGDMASYATTDAVDMVVSLHACDTATDIALARAVQWQTKVILCVPCCQHELAPQISNSMLIPLLQQGILKDRFAALVTDSARAQLLELVGYQTQVMEFIDSKHTAKNLLIRAVRDATLNDVTTQWAQYQLFKTQLNITPILENLLVALLPSA